jgi:hypothetical protein
MTLMALSVVLATASTPADRPHLDGYGSTLRSIARSIEALKRDYPQLVEFSASSHTDVDGLKITYAYRTERAAPTGGWAAGVPSPTEGGVWLYIDFHDADSTAEIHTQPVVPRYRFWNKRVILLLREGSGTKPLELALIQVLADHGIEPDPGPSRR